MKTSCTSIPQYISHFPRDVQIILKNIRKTIRNLAPSAKEAICYGIPTFKLNGNLVHFAAYKNHIGFYPTPSGIRQFKNELSKFKTSKGTVQFEIDQPVPYNLIKRIVRFNVKENNNPRKYTVAKK